MVTLGGVGGVDCWEDSVVFTGRVRGFGWFSAGEKVVEWKGLGAYFCPVNGEKCR